MRYLIALVLLLSACDEDSAPLPDGGLADGVACHANRDCHSNYCDAEQRVCTGP